MHTGVNGSRLIQLDFFTSNLKRLKLKTIALRCLRVTFSLLHFQVHGLIFKIMFIIIKLQVLFLFGLRNYSDRTYSVWFKQYVVIKILIFL